MISSRNLALKKVLDLSPLILLVALMAIFAVVDPRQPFARLDA